MQSVIFLLGLALCVASVSSFGNGEDKFIKKYAMMKIYESCFGPEVVRQIRREMKAACAKCAALEAPPLAPHPPEAAPLDEPQQLPQPVPPQQQPSQQAAGGIDVEKLHQAIMAYRPGPMAQPSLRPFVGSGNGIYNPLFNQGFSNAAPGGYPFFYPAASYQQMPAFAPYGAFPAPALLGQPFYGNRMSRDMDIKSQLELLTSKMSGRVRNVTCVMQELGYLDENLEPNYTRIRERIGKLPVNDELRKDMQDGVTFCQQFSQCVPEVKKDRSPLSRELIRPMFFFKCYKHKKLEACIMKDVRDKYAGIADDELDNDVEFKRQGKSAKLEDNEAQINDLASSVYEFLYASDSSIDIDGIL